jgi:hypothetical protein
LRRLLIVNVARRICQRSADFPPSPLRGARDLVPASRRAPDPPEAIGCDLAPWSAALRSCWRISDTGRSRRIRGFGNSIRREIRHPTRLLPQDGPENTTGRDDGDQTSIRKQARPHTLGHALPSRGAGQEVPLSGPASASPRASAVGHPRAVKRSPCRIGPPGDRPSGGATQMIVPSTVSGPR